MNYKRLEDVYRLKFESPSSLEKKVYLCLTELLTWRQMGTGEILITTRFAHIDSFVTVVITGAGLLGLQENSPLPITAHMKGCYTL